MKNITVDTIIRFNDDPNCERMVVRITRYRSFLELMENENPKKIHPKKSIEEQWDDIQKIFSPEKEKMGILAFELKSV